MKTNLRGKIREFMQSEEGKVGIKSPLTLGIATGSVLLAQAIIGPTKAMAYWDNNGCNGDEECVGVGRACWEDQGTLVCIDVEGTCM